MHMSHHIMSKLAFVTIGRSKVDVIDRGSHFFELSVGDVQPQFLLTFCQRNPESPPGGVLRLSRPDGRHFPGGVSGNQRVFVDLVGHRRNLWRRFGIANAR
jgi:hypothetical protein